MIGMQHEADVECPHHGLSRLFTAEHPKEVARDRPVRVGGDDFLALAMSIKGGDQGRRLRDQTNRFSNVRFGAVVVTFRIKERQGRDQRLDHMHGRGVGGRLSDHRDQALGEGVLGTEFRFEAREFGGVGESSIPEQEG